MNCYTPNSDLGSTRSSSLNLCKSFDISILLISTGFTVEGDLGTYSCKPFLPFKIFHATVFCVF